MSSTINDYLRLSQEDRDAMRTNAHSLLVRARESYTNLLAAEAMIAARKTLPNAARLVFSVGDDVFGPSVSLVGVYDSAGKRLWFIEWDDEWPDESEVTDLLASAVDYGDSRYDPFDSMDDDLYEYTLPEE